MQKVSFNKGNWCQTISVRSIKTPKMAGRPKRARTIGMISQSNYFLLAHYCTFNASLWFYLIMRVYLKETCSWISLACNQGFLLGVVKPWEEGTWWKSCSRSWIAWVPFKVSLQERKAKVHLENTNKIALAIRKEHYRCFIFMCHIWLRWFYSSKLEHRCEMSRVKTTSVYHIALNAH